MEKNQSLQEKFASGFLSFLGFSHSRTRTERNARKVFYEGYLSGYQYHQGQQLEHLFHEGTTSFLLKPEPENPFDDNAVAVYYNDAKIGFIPHDTTEEIAELMRKGQRLQARLAKFQPDVEPWQRVYVEVSGT